MTIKWLNEYTIPTRVRAREKGTRGYKSVLRGTPWGNKYTIAEYGRERAVELFKKDLEALSDQDLFDFIEPLLLVKTIGCTCTSPVCHASILIACMMYLQDKYN